MLLNLIFIKKKTIKIKIIGNKFNLELWKKIFFISIDFLFPIIMIVHNAP